MLNYLGLFVSDSSTHTQASLKPESRIKIAMGLFGLIICVRHDLALLLFPATAYVFLRHIKVFSARQWLVLGVLAALPFLAYSLFALIYYGFPFPNTAYAKLSTGIDKTAIIKQGIKYFYSSLRYDSITLLVIAGSLALTFFRPAANGLRYLAAGMVLNLCYVAYVGGDFMQGRFFSYAYLVAVILLLLQLNTFQFRAVRQAGLVLLCAYLVVYPHTPFNSSLSHFNGQIVMGIADERGFYFRRVSLYQYLLAKTKGELFPDNKRTRQGIKFRDSVDKLAVIRNIGFFGYQAGLDKIIIDPLALSDPLLARMPVTGGWRIGHFERPIPEGYAESVLGDEPIFLEPGLNEYYEKLALVTQSDKLFAPERLQAILLFNLGAYDYFLPELPATAGE